MLYHHGTQHVISRSTSFPSESIYSQRAVNILKPNTLPTMNSDSTPTMNTTTKPASDGGGMAEASVKYLSRFGILPAHSPRPEEEQRQNQIY